MERKLTSEILQFPDSAPKVPDNVVYNDWLAAIKEHHQEMIDLVRKDDLPEKVRNALYNKMIQDMDQATQIWGEIDKNILLMERFLTNWEILKSKKNISKDDLV